MQKNKYGSQRPEFLLPSESVTPEDAELILKVFKRLEPNRSTGTYRFWDAEHQRHEREWKQAYDQTGLERAFHFLTLLGFARQVSDGYYNLLDPKITANVVMRTLLKHPYDMAQRGLNDFRRHEDYAKAVLWSAFIFGAAFAVAFSQQIVPVTTYSQFVGVAFLVIFLGGVWLKDLSSQFWDRQRLSNEKKTAVMLVDGYDLYIDPDRDETTKATEIVRDVSQMLRAARELTRWNTVSQLRAKLSEIGEDIDNKVLPAMMDKNRKKTDIGEILVHLACLFFQGSPESMRRVPEVYQRLPGPAKRETPAPVPIMIRLRKRMSDPKIRTVIALMLSAVMTYALIYFGTAMTNVAFPPMSTNLLTVAVAIAAITALVRYLLPG
jgi:hypothetical protein